MAKPAKPGTIREPDPTWPINPRNIDHPLHDEKWLELASALGRMEAREEFELLQLQRQRNKERP
jgi:hypothetical protein